MIAKERNKTHVVSKNEATAFVYMSATCRSLFILPLGDQGSQGSIPLGPATFFRGDYHELFFNVIPLIQEEHLSVSGERMCTSTG